MPNDYNSTKPIVEMKNIRKEFPGVVALENVDLELYPGEVHALMGENGSGKSTLIKILSGFFPPTNGTIKIDGEEVNMSSPSKALDLGIVSITQELSLAPTLSVAENVLLGRLPRKGIKIDWEKTYREAELALAQLDVFVDVRRKVQEFSTELQQEFEIARAISINSRVLILDEATSSLSAKATKKLLDKVEQFRKKGVAIVIVSHRIGEIYASAQKATILRDGKFIDVVSVKDTPESLMVQKMVGRPITDLFPNRLGKFDNEELPLLEVRNLSTMDGKVEDISFSIRKGEIVGVAGLVGCGKTELGLALFGATQSRYKDYIIDGKSLNVRKPIQAIKEGVAFVPEDRKISSILATRSVCENFSVTWLDKLKKGIKLDVNKEKNLAELYRDKFGVKTPSIHTKISSLSGGNQQKIVLGRWFENNPKLVILTEPTRGVDIRAKKEIYEYIHELTQNGVAVIVISSELPEILGLSDRIFVMYQGRIKKEFTRNEATEERIAHVAFGGNVLLSNVSN